MCLKKQAWTTLFDMTFEQKQDLQTHLLLPLGPFKTLEEAIGWVSEHLPVETIDHDQLTSKTTYKALKSFISTAVWISMEPDLVFVLDMRRYKDKKLKGYSVFRNRAQDVTNFSAHEIMKHKKWFEQTYK